MFDQPITQLARGIRAQDVSPTELTRHALTAAHRHDDHLHAFIAIDDNGALTRAGRLETELAHGSDRGPLHGIPLALKDNLYVAGETTTMGSKIHADFIPDYTATTVQRLLDAGAIPIGKSNMHEYALGASTDNPYFGTCRNPWNLEYSPGGSSGGSAVAVASGTVPAAIGSDTSGSIHIPAAMCAISGLKPTYGRTSRFGCFPEAWSLDTVGPLAAHVEDLAVILDSIAGSDPHDPFSIAGPPTATATQLNPTVQDLTLGVVDDFWFHDIDPDIERLIRSGISQLEDLGAHIEPLEIPSLSEVEDALTVIDTAESTTVHYDQLQTQAQDYGNDVRELLEAGNNPSAVDYLRAQQTQEKIRTDPAHAFTQVDALIGPVLPIQVPHIGQKTIGLNGRQVPVGGNLSRLLGPANLAGLPSLSVPCGLIEGLPAGLQIITAAGDEQAAINIAAAYEATDPLAGAPDHLCMMSDDRSCQDDIAILTR